jgi:hypothetical protein
VSFLNPCEVTQTGQWGLTIKRSSSLQNYTVRAYYYVPADVVLEEGVQAYGSLPGVTNEKYYRYNVPEFTVDNETQAQLFFIVENILGGTVKMEVVYNGDPSERCSTTNICVSREGCHVVLPYCQVQSGFYQVIITVLVLDRTDHPVQFAVEAHLNQIGTNYFNAGETRTYTLHLSEYHHHRIGFEKNEGEWVDLELYVDHDMIDNAALMYIGNIPFPANDQQNRNGISGLDESISGGNYRIPLVDEFPTCNRNYNRSFWQRCEAILASSPSKTLRFCNLQLDPCELARFPNGIFLTVFNTNTTSSPQLGGRFGHTWAQNPMSYTLITKIWSPNQYSNVISHGTVSQMLSITTTNVLTSSDLKQGL